MEHWWKCTRIADKTVCGHRNPARKRNCEACGKPQPARRRPAHLDALELAYADYVALNGGEFCGICGRKPNGVRKLHRDHDHSTGRPRGILCFRCNAALRAYMTADWLRKALAYVERSEPNPLDIQGGGGGIRGLNRLRQGERGQR